MDTNTHTNKQLVFTFKRAGQLGNCHVGQICLLTNLPSILGWKLKRLRKATTAEDTPRLVGMCFRYIFHSMALAFHPKHRYVRMARDICRHHFASFLFQLRTVETSLYIFLPIELIEQQVRARSINVSRSWSPAAARRVRSPFATFTQIDQTGICLIAPF